EGKIECCTAGLRCQAAAPYRLAKKVKQFGLFRFRNPAQAALAEQPAAPAVLDGPDAVVPPCPMVVEIVDVALGAFLGLAARQALAREHVAHDRVVAVEARQD